MEKALAPYANQQREAVDIQRLEEHPELAQTRRFGIVAGLARRRHYRNNTMKTPVLHHR
jgi:hypothetical protein